MGQDSHYTSNLRVMDYDITGVATLTATNIKAAALYGMTTLTADTITATTITVDALTATTVRANSYFKIGAHQYIFGGEADLATSVAKAATAVDASCQGSMYFSKDGILFIMVSDTAASRYATIS